MEGPKKSLVKHDYYQKIEREPSSVEKANDQIQSVVKEFKEGNDGAMDKCILLLLQEPKEFTVPKCDGELDAEIRLVPDENTRNIVAQFQSDAVYKELYAVGGSRGPVSSLHFTLGFFRSYWLIRSNLENGHLAKGILVDGDGQAFNISEAQYNFEKVVERFLYCATLVAKESKSPEHALRLAEIYESGTVDGIPIDVSKALEYYHLAYSKGSHEAAQRACQIFGSNYAPFDKTM